MRMRDGDFAADRRRYPAHSWLLQPAIWAIAVYRFGRWTLRAPRLLRPGVHALYFFMYSIVRLAVGIDIPRTVRIGPGLMIHHFGGIVLNPAVTIGDNCTLRHGVTIGNRSDGGPVPILGDNVNLGAYCQILGGVRVGDGAQVGAMSVVLGDVPDNATAVGIPARVLGRI